MGEETMACPSCWKHGPVHSVACWACGVRWADFDRAATEYARHLPSGAVLVTGQSNGDDGIVLGTRTKS